MRLKRLTHALRRHIHFLVIVPLLILLMTWPTAAHVFDTSSFWLAGDNIDAHMLFWDAWYLKLLISGQADFFYTDLLFHPNGVSLAFHNFSLPHMILFAGLQAIMPASNAYNLTFLLLSFITAASGYIYLIYLFRDKWVALFGAVVFGTGAFILARPAHPNIAFIATIPLSLYCLHRGLLEARLKLLLLAGVMIGATAFIGMYTLVCLLLLLMAYSLYFACQRWRDRRFWLQVCLMLLVIGGFLALRFYPMLADTQGLSSALSKFGSHEAGKDLLGYFVNTRHPITHPVVSSLFRPRLFDASWHNVVFLGYIPLLLLALAFIRMKDRRRLLPWLVIALSFLVLRLGSWLTVNGVQYHHITLPKYYLTDLLPHLFRPFWATDNFHAGALFPFAVLACFGLSTLLKSVPVKFWRSAVLLLSLGVAFEYWQAPTRYVLPEGRLDFIDWLRQEEGQDSIHLINVPFSPGHFKVYGFLQTYNAYPHVAGRPTRTPAAAFDYINGNLILQAWEKDEAFLCLPGNRDEFIAAQDQLLADGFTHIIFHRYRRGLNQEAKTVRYVPAVYEDNAVSIFRVEDLHLNCSSSAALSAGQRSNLAGLHSWGQLLPAQRVSVLSIHSYSMSDGRLFDYYSAMDQSAAAPAPLRQEDLPGPGSSRPGLMAIDADAELAASDIVLIAYDPRHSGQPEVADYEAWVSRRFGACGVVNASDSIMVALYLRPDLPCALVNSADPLVVRYDNEARLSHLVLEQHEAYLDLYLLWTQLPEANHSASIQLFDADGSKAFNSDFVLPDELITYQRVDISTVAPGEYQVKLIVYNYETGASVPGEVISSETRFERELTLASLTVE